MHWSIQQNQPQTTGNHDLPIQLLLCFQIQLNCWLTMDLVLQGCLQTSRDKGHSMPVLSHISLTTATDTSHNGHRDNGSSALFFQTQFCIWIDSSSFFFYSSWKIHSRFLHNGITGGSCISLLRSLQSKFFILTTVTACGEAVSSISGPESH